MKCLKNILMEEKESVFNPLEKCGKQTKFIGKML